MEGQEKYINYTNHLATDVMPFVHIPDEKEALSLSLAIDTLVMPPDDASLNFFNRDKETKEYHAHTIKRVKEAIKTKKIDENAPWFKKLSDSLLRHEIYLSADNPTES